MKENRPDVFDRIMRLPGLQKYYTHYQKHKSVLLYLFFGGLTTLISIGSFIFFDSWLAIHPLLSNILSWVCAVSFAYTTNRIWVFASTATGKDAVQEGFSFFTGRLLTLGFEELILLVFVQLMGLNSTLIKILAQLGVLILNYVISRLFVFKKSQ